MIHYMSMMIGLKHFKQSNNFITMSYKILYYSFMKKTKISFQSQIQEMMILILYQKRNSQVCLSYIFSKMI